VGEHRVGLVNLVERDAVDARRRALATQSLVFAFLSPPVGAILGHLALARIRRTGEPGRNRAVAGVALSYALVALLVIALAGGGATGGGAGGTRPSGS
ncbi:DUF4190 domain-containing protein, partial [Mycobacterium sp. E787]|uniref:DUF4190 domain-containing protein n=1 Tax=Mycobacterium sp. E787 TaxID=1834150 RepID=UPI000A77E314